MGFAQQTCLGRQFMAFTSPTRLGRSPTSVSVRQLHVNILSTMIILFCEVPDWEEALGRLLSLRWAALYCSSVL